MNKKSKVLRLTVGAFLVYIGIEYIRYWWIGIPFVVIGILLVIDYIRQMKKKEED